MGSLTDSAHRDEVALVHDGVAIRNYGSQGQQRVALLALLFAERDLLGRERGRRPLMLLDDVMSELDRSRRELLSELLRAEGGTLVCVTRHGFVCANAGVDQSNASEAPGELVLLPEEPDRSASRLRAGIEAVRGVRPAVVIADSFGRAWRTGQCEVAIGCAGLAPSEDWRGLPDSDGRELTATVTDQRQETTNA